MIPVYLSGGSGTRLWPLSRSSMPKQFLSVTGDQSLLQHSMQRLLSGSYKNLAAPIIICQEEHRFLVAEQLRQINCPLSAIILEPCMKNTAAAVAVAAVWASINGLDPVMSVFPADHVIGDLPAFHLALSNAEKAALDGAIVTLGIQPSSPHTGFGYIEANFETGQTSAKLRRFIEKPELVVAEKLIEQGNVYWNAGIFVFKASVMLEQFRLYAPDILKFVEEAIAKAEIDHDFIRLNANAFTRVPSESVDVAVMEKTQVAKVVALNSAWSDVGSWQAWWESSAPDVDGNVFSGDVIAVDAKNTLVQAQSRLVGVVGLTDMVVVETPDAVLVMPQKKSQDIKKLIDLLKKSERTELDLCHKSFRPWGSFESLAQGLGYQVKRLRVNPHGKLSLQYHHSRAEHWVVVHGTARVTVGEQTFFLNENESTYIPQGVAHRLENPSEKLLEVIEVQSGSYLGEDDIVRIEDQYGRSD